MTPSTSLASRERYHSDAADKIIKYERSCSKEAANEEENAPSKRFY